MEISMDEFKRQLKEAVRAEMEEAENAPPQPWHSFWRHQTGNEFPPRTIRSPEDYKQGERVSIACTQTDLSVAAQKNLVRQWCALLPTLDNVKFVWFQSRVSQELFDAACQMPGLEGLYVKWSGIQHLDALQAARGLKYFHLKSSGAVVGIRPLETMVGLKWLELEGIKNVTDLRPLAGLRNLDGLGFVGAEGKRHTVESFKPLAALENLRWLHLGAIHTTDGVLCDLARLKNLRWLGLGNFFDVLEFARLALQLPGASCDWFVPYKDLGKLGIRCKKCKQESMVMLSGKGRGTICPVCDGKRLERQVELFQSAVS